jgi:CRP/FNR family cyclic AMP-dependent transcriptional regulator
MEKQGILQRVDIFEGLTPDELDMISRFCEDRRYQADELIFAENSKGKEIYILQKGKVRIDLGLKVKSNHTTIHRITEGQVFGELALIDNGRRSATAKCESNSEIIAIDRDRLHDLFERNSHVGYVVLNNLARILVARLRRTNLQLIASILWE